MIIVVMTMVTMAMVIIVRMIMMVTMVTMGLTIVMIMVTGDDVGFVDCDEFTSSMLDSVLEVAVAVFNMQVAMFIGVWLT